MKLELWEMKISTILLEGDAVREKPRLLKLYLLILTALYESNLFCRYG